ncbi:MAG: hypothetical protein WBE99_17955, partial [Xanthobacteraceae bacterium]
GMAETPLSFTYAAEYSPKDIRGRVMAMVIYTTEVFPTNARGTGLGTAFAAGRLGGTLAGSAIVFIQAFGIVAVFAALSVALAIGAVAVFLIGVETSHKALDTIAPPTR